MRPLIGLASLLIAFQATAAAVVPLGAELPPAARSERAGPYLVAVYARGCLEPDAFRRHWAALLASGVPVVALNPPDPRIPLLAAPAGVERSLEPAAALAVRRELKVRAYPTTLVIGADHRILATLEGPVDAARLRTSLELARSGP